jgi:methylated-DNA-protein-cysteine methyltransferase-like protein
MIQPPDPEAYHALVWEIVCQIPAGRVSTYGQIASMIPPPEGWEPQQYDPVGARWVGGAMHAVPEGSGIPWQRVINSQGMVSIPKGRPGHAAQRALLEAEGVVFNERDRVDLRVYGWEGPPADWLSERGLLPPLLFNPPSPQDTDQAAQLTLF